MAEIVVPEPFEGPSVEPDPTGRVSAALERSLLAMDWLTDADDAAVEVARYLAGVLDHCHAVASRDQDPSLLLKAQNFAPHLKNVLNDLGGTPVSRGAVGGDDVQRDPTEEALGDFARKAREKKKRVA